MDIDAHTIATDHANTFLAAAGDHRFSAPPPLQAGLAEAGSNDYDPFDAFSNTVIDRTFYVIEGGRDNRQVYRSRDVAQAGIGWPAQYFRHRWIDQINIAGESSSDQLLGGDVAPFV